MEGENQSSEAREKFDETLERAMETVASAFATTCVNRIKDSPEAKAVAFADVVVRVKRLLSEMIKFGFVTGLVIEYDKEAEDGEKARPRFFVNGVANLPILRAMEKHGAYIENFASEQIMRDYIAPRVVKSLDKFLEQLFDDRTQAPEEPKKTTSGD